MRPPKPGPLTASGVLIILVAMIGTVPQNVATGLIETLLVGLLACELDRSGRHIAMRAIVIACRVLPRQLRSDYEDEWRDHIMSAEEHGLRPLLVALSIITRAVPALAFRYRVRPAAWTQVIWVNLGFLSAWVFAIGIMSFPARATNRGPRKALTSLPALSRLIATWTLPILLIPGIRAPRWPSWLIFVVGIALWTGAWTGMLLTDSTPIKIACTVEFVLYGVGLALVGPVYSSNYHDRVRDFIRGNA